jgi:hypothetical protein
VAFVPKIPLSLVIIARNETRFGFFSLSSIMRNHASIACFYVALRVRDVKQPAGDLVPTSRNAPRSYLLNCELVVQNRFSKMRAHRPVLIDDFHNLWMIQ